MQASTIDRVLLFDREVLPLLDRGDSLVNEHLEGGVAKRRRRHLSADPWDATLKQAERQSASVKGGCCKNGYTSNFSAIAVIPGILNSGGGNDFRNLHFFLSSRN